MYFHIALRRKTDNAITPALNSVYNTLNCSLKTLDFISSRAKMVNSCHNKYIFNRNQMLTVHNIIAKNCLIVMHRIYKNSYPKNVMSIC